MTRLALQRGLIVTVASDRVDSGKPRPAVVGELEAAALAELDLALRSWLELN